MFFSIDWLKIGNQYFHHSLTFFSSCFFSIIICSISSSCCSTRRLLVKSRSAIALSYLLLNFKIIMKIKEIIESDYLYNPVSSSSLKVWFIPFTCSLLLGMSKSYRLLAVEFIELFRTDVLILNVEIKLSCFLLIPEYQIFFFPSFSVQASLVSQWYSGLYQCCLGGQWWLCGSHHSGPLSSHSAATI